MSPTETRPTEPGREERGPGAPAPQPAREARGEEARADRFVRELAELKIPDPAAGRAGLWLRLGAVLMVAGAVLAVVAYAVSHGTRDPLLQRDAITLGLGGITAAVIGSAVFLRYSLTGFLRFWMARQSYDIAQLTDRLPEREGRE